jgi:hypothetical protein
MLLRVLEATKDISLVRLSSLTLTFSILLMMSLTLQLLMLPAALDNGADMLLLLASSPNDFSINELMSCRRFVKDSLLLSAPVLTVVERGAMGFTGVAFADAWLLPL